ncbi:MAG: DcrB-related protein [Polyangiaceae bacterium]|nr:DcrB-related protein [Polyangiaceae bacterium]
MTIYNIAEASFQLHGEWVDETTNMLKTPAPDGSFVTIIIHRLPRDGRSMAEYGEYFFNEQRRSLQGFNLLGRRPVAVDGMEGEEAVFQWVHPESLMHHHVFLFPIGTRILSVVASARAKFSAGCEELVMSWLSSLRWRRS